MKLLLSLYAVALAAKKKSTNLETSHPEVFIDEVYYPRHILDELSKKGVNVDGWKEAVLMEGKNSARGITTATQWSELTDEGKIAVPYSYHVASFNESEYSEISEYSMHKYIDAAMARLSNDIGCVEMVKVRDRIFNIVNTFLTRIF